MAGKVGFTDCLRCAVVSQRSPICRSFKPGGIPPAIAADPFGGRAVKRVGIALPRHHRFALRHGREPLTFTQNHFGQPTHFRFGQVAQHPVEAFDDQLPANVIASALGQHGIPEPNVLREILRR